MLSALSSSVALVSPPMLGSAVLRGFTGRASAMARVEEQAHY